MDHSRDGPANEVGRVGKHLTVTHGIFFRKTKIETKPNFYIPPDMQASGTQDCGEIETKSRVENTFHLRSDGLVHYTKQIIEENAQIIVLCCTQKEKDR